MSNYYTTTSSTYSIPVATACPTSTTTIDIDKDKIASLIASAEQKAIQDHYTDLTRYKKQLDGLLHEETIRQSKEIHEQKKKQDELSFLAQNPEVANKKRRMDLDRLEDEETRKKNENDRKMKMMETQARTELLLKEKRHADFVCNTKYAGYMLVGVGLSFIVTASHL